MSFTKLFSSIVSSTIWQESLETKIVWITMLALSDRDGIVDASVPGLAKQAGVTLEQTEQALSVLESPDPYSRTKDHEGRRVEPVDGGWRLLNHSKYREKLSREDRREKAANRQRVKRERESSRSVTPCHAPSRSVTLRHAESHIGHARSRMSPHADADADADADAEREGEGERVTRERASAQPPPSVPQAVEFATWTAEKQARRFQAEFESKHQTIAAMGGKAVGGFHENVLRTAELQLRLPEEVFSEALCAFLSRSLSEIERRAPYACFAASWGDLTARTARRPDGAPLNGRAEPPPLSVLRPGFVRPNEE